MKLTIKDAPACLNTSDKAMWLLGYNEAIEKLNSAEPVAWTHSCNVLCLDNVELWIDRCPHCGKPSPLVKHPPAPSAINVSLTSEGKTNQLADFIYRFKRHVGGDGEFWLHELEDFYFGEVSAARSDK